MSAPREDESAEARLRKALEECERLRSENARLKQMLESFSVRSASSLPPRESEREHIEPLASTESVSTRAETPASVAEQRIALFRSLFRGRDDVYAVRWENKKGKAGYAPACANEWHPLLCHKPCAKCPNPEYKPLTDEVLRDHLLGQMTVGVYPLLKEDTCYFLAVDFDKAGWIEDSQAYLKTCADMKVPAALERSRSGKGGHVWIFFAESVPAALARQLGSAILTRTMEGRHQVGLDSYDRFFPNQDTLPKGGFGNLIALPLQRKAREQGNSVFVDEYLLPFPSQWEYLASLKRMPQADVEKLVQDAARKGKVIGVRMSLADDTEDEDPWTLPPSKKRPERPIGAALPARVSMVRANLLYIDRSSLPSPALNCLIRIAAFQNPEFYSAQSMRMSTFGKPRIISCAEEFPDHLALPRSCLDEVEAFFTANGSAVDEVDKRNPGLTLDVSFQGSLRREQVEVAARLLEHDDGVLCAPTGFGKTALASWVISQRKANTLVLVHRTSLLEQWREQMSLFLGLDASEIGVIGAGKRKPTSRLDLAMLQSLHKKGTVDDAVAEYGQVIVDECHHVSAVTFERIMREVKARYVLGLTATPIRKDGHHPIIFMQCGPLRTRIRPQHTASHQSFEHRVIFRDTGLTVLTADTELTIHELYNMIVRDPGRNALIVSDVVQSVADGRASLVLTERVEHLDLLASLLEGKVNSIHVIRGGMKRKDRTAVMDEVTSLAVAEPFVILATGRYAGEGFDVPRLDTLFLAMPVSWKGTLQQYVGRLHRQHADKREVRVYDYVDLNIPMFQRMLARRMRGYRALGYATGDQLALPGVAG